MSKITGQVQYLGPQFPQVGLSYGMIFRDGIYEHLYDAIAECRVLGELFIPVAQVGAVRRQLNFGIDKQIRPTENPSAYQNFYIEVEKWRTKKTNQQKPSPKGVNLKTHHA